jgi:polyisoprenoid-binding protein YceI
MRQSFTAGLIALLLLAHPEATGAQEGHVYAISEADSLLYVQVFRQSGTLGSRFTHNHVIRATKFNGEIRFDPQTPRACLLQLTVPVRQLAVDEADMRRRVGYQKEIDDDAREDVRESMLDDGQLHAEKYPNVTVRARDCVPVSDDGFRARVSVTIRGETATTRVPLTIRVVDGELDARGEFTLRHSDFGMEPYSAVFGAVQNAEPIRFVARLRAE